MIGGEELIFSGAYKDFKLGVKYDLSGASDKVVAAILSSLSEKIEGAAYQFSEIDIKKIDSFVSPTGKGVEAVLSFLNNNSQSEIKKELLSACPIKELLPAAESYFFNLLLKKTGVPFKIQMDSPKGDPEDVEAQITFIGKFGKWMTIKKLSLEKVEDYEVSAILCGINNTIVNKSFELSGIKKNDKLVSEVTGGRKSFGNLLTSLEKLKGKLSGNQFEDAYVISKIFVEMGYPPYATQNMLVKAHKDVKPPKPKGRVSKG